MLALIGASSRRLVTQTFTSNGTWVAPITTTRLESASGHGAAGTPGSTASSGNVLVDTVQGVSTGTGAHSGTFDWSGFTGASDTAAAINNGTQGSTFTYINYTGHPNSNTYDDTLGSGVVLQPYVRGSAHASYSAGWKFSGAVLSSDFGQSFISYQYTTAATTGASASAFGHTFPGGTGGAASTTTFTNVTVTPGASYPITVPAGGSITISYYQ